MGGSRRYSSIYICMERDDYRHLPQHHSAIATMTPWQPSRSMPLWTFIFFYFWSTKIQKPSESISSNSSFSTPNIKKLPILGIEGLFSCFINTLIPTLLLVATKNRLISSQIRGKIQLPSILMCSRSTTDMIFPPSTPASQLSTHCRSRRCATAHISAPTSCNPRERDEGCCCQAQRRARFVVRREKRR